MLVYCTSVCLLFQSEVPYGGVLYVCLFPSELPDAGVLYVCLLFQSELPDGGGAVFT